MKTRFALGALLALLALVPIAYAATPAASVDVVHTLDSRLCATVDVQISLSSRPGATLLIIR